MSATQDERDRAARLARLAVKAGRGLGGACPYDANGSAKQRQLSLVFVRAYMGAGGILDGLDYGDGSSSTSTRTRRRTGNPSTADRPAADPRGKSSGAGRRPYGHLGYLE